MRVLWLLIFTCIFNGSALSMDSDLDYDVEVCSDSVEMGKKAADIVLEVVKKHPDAVVILPTGSTPIKMYKALVESFREDPTVDFSSVTFFNLDEYIGLSEEHPLSYHFYMQKVFYDKLDATDRARAPKSRYIPGVKGQESPGEAAKCYEEILSSAIRATGRGKADLVVLGIGGAYPVFKEGKFVGLEGGHIGFNEPGSTIDDKTKIVKLTAKTKKDTAFRFRSLKFREDGEKYSIEVPSQAITLGIADILNSEQVVLLANGEEKSIVVFEALTHEPNPKFPATFLKLHPKVKWIFDNDAASRLSYVKTPWKNNPDFVWDRKAFRQAAIVALENTSSIDALTKEDLPKAGDLNQVKTDIKSCLKSAFTYIDEHFEKGDEVLIFSPHPDDDVITMAATMKRLKEKGCVVRVAYLTSGENSVRDQFAAPIYDKLKGYSDDQERQREARILVRELEAKEAVAKLDVDETIFLRLPYYYQRGFVDLPSITDKDVQAVQGLLERVNPKHIFYSAEADPHGAHGLGKEVMRRALGSDSQAIVYGYRGAYEEWPLYDSEGLVIHAFDHKMMDEKIDIIKCHRSQINPLFPSFDVREFWERARDRNQETGLLLKKMGYSGSYAEVFKRVSLLDLRR